MPPKRAAALRNEAVKRNSSSARSSRCGPSTSKASSTSRNNHPPMTFAGGATTVTVVNRSERRLETEAPPQRKITPNVTITPTTAPPTHPETRMNGATVFEDFMKHQSNETLQHMFRGIEMLFPQQRQRPMDMSFVPDRNNREFPFLLGLDVVADFLSGQPTASVVRPFRCERCHIDFTPSWKLTRHPDRILPVVVCEECMIADVKKMMKYKYCKNN